MPKKRFPEYALYLFTLQSQCISWNALSEKLFFFRQVLRTSVFLISKCLKTSNKRTHIPLFINQFASLTELKM